MTRDEFLDLLGAVNLIPGPNSTEMAIHIGHRRAGFAGLLVAGTSFILPAAAIVLAIAWAYGRYGALPGVGYVMSGVKPVIIAIVFHALVRLGQTAVKTIPLAIIGAYAIAASFAGVNELAVLFGAGAVAVAVRAADFGRGRTASALVPVAAPLGAAPLAAASAGSIGLAPIFLLFLKVGAVLFGSGYVLLAFLRADLVERWHWLTDAQLLDAIAVGQITPGPVFTTATFIGYVLAGVKGALVATAGIFLPAFVFVAASAPLVPRLRRSPTLAAFLDGVNVGSLALMVVVTFWLGRGALINGWTAALAVAAALALLVFRKLSSAWLALAGAVVGALVHHLR
jgi:chromate transporter